MQVLGGKLLVWVERKCLAAWKYLGFGFLAETQRSDDRRVTALRMCMLDDVDCWICWDIFYERKVRRCLLANSGGHFEYVALVAGPKPPNARKNDLIVHNLKSKTKHSQLHIITNESMLIVRDCGGGLATHVSRQQRTPRSEKSSAAFSFFLDFPSQLIK